MADKDPVLTVDYAQALSVWKRTSKVFENFVIVQDEPDMYVLEYASTPEFYEAYGRSFIAWSQAFGFTTIRSCRVCQNEE